MPALAAMANPACWGSRRHETLGNCLAVFSTTWSGEPSSTTRISVPDRACFVMLFRQAFNKSIRKWLGITIERSTATLFLPQAHDPIEAFPRAGTAFGCQVSGDIAQTPKQVGRFALSPLLGQRHAHPGFHLDDPCQ